ncbi:MAG: GNAT family N-acetyltransferase [Hyphomicrobiales bacterium]
MNFSIRLATLSDIPALVPLCLEMETHYQGDKAIDESTARRRLTHWFEKTSDSVMLVATKDRALVGHAVICPLFPAGNLDTAWFLKDIFVANAARGEGIGEALIKACAKETLRRKGARFDLTVDAGNVGARALYERLGAIDTHKAYLRWDGDALASLAESAS